MVLNLQFWEKDKAQAMALARLIADLEEKPRNDVTFLFSARFDCEHDEDTISYVAAKFPVIRYTTKRKATGWPHGPNEMMACSYEHLVLLKRRKWMDHLSCVLFMEADCAPLHRDWINLIKKEYDGCGKKVLGAWLMKGADCQVEHVNGNCVVSMDFWKRCPAMFHPDPRWGWDAALAYAILPSAAPSKLIWSDYQLGQPNNPWRGDDFLWEAKRYPSKDNPLYGKDLFPAYMHGIKTMQGIEAVRKRLLNEPKNNQDGLRSLRDGDGHPSVAVG